ncbi:hypothetical protein DRW07_01485 [Alteromonas sediminis]|uniref:Uncharacterized protein n=2 Tax=Alteromonas sediminis TaxID=2259342 RepID=A0A3N5YFH8_9ALTE|nr:hypothetical protein DRW07_01485 [Alteromonas sediminis]
MIFVFILALVSKSVLSDTVTIRADEWYPINGDPNSNKPGFMIELAKAVLEPAGHSVDYQVMPWERALDSVRKGSHDCVVGAYKEDAPDFVFPKNHWGLDSTGFFVNNDSDWKFDSLNSLLTKKVGVINGYAYGEELDELISNNPSVFSGLGGNDALEKNIKKLTAGRIDIIIESPNVMRAKLEELKLSNVKQAGTLGEASPMYIACSPAKPSSSNYVELIDKGTDALRASGKLSEILARYGMSDWE